MMRLWKLVVLGVIFLFCCVILYIVSLPPKTSHLPQNSEEDNPILLHDWNMEKIQTLTIEDNTGQKVTLTNDQEPTMEGLDKAVIHPLSIFNALYGFSMIKGLPVPLNQSLNYDMYGLNHPTYIIKALSNNEDVLQLLIGDKTIDGKAYYGVFAGDSSLYTIDKALVEQFSTNIDDYRIKELPNIDYSQLHELSLIIDDTISFSIVRTDALDESLRDKYSTFSLINPYIAPVSDYKYEQFVSKLPVLEADKLIATNVTDLTPYGLDNPVLIITAIVQNPTTETKEEFQVHFGHNRDNQLIYFKYANQPTVYAMKNNFMDELKTYKPFDIISPMIHIQDMEDVDKIKLITDDESYLFTINRSANTNASLNQKEIYFLNNKQLTEEDFKKVYQQMIAISADADNKNDNLSAHLELSITYTLTDGETKTINYFTYNELFSYYKVSDTYSFLCANKQINQLIDTLREISKNTTQ